MINSRKELKKYLAIEAAKLNIHHFWLQWLSGSEFACIYNYMWVLRHLEYFMSKSQSSKIFTPPHLIFLLWHRKLRIKYGIHLGPGVAAEGFHIVHLGFLRCYGIAQIGRNCTVLPMVLFGKKRPGIGEGRLITVGDNCYFGTGCTVLAPCHIGNNVTVAAGAVVTMEEIPDNVVVAGVPARIVKRKKRNCPAR